MGPGDRIRKKDLIVPPDRNIGILKLKMNLMDAKMSSMKCKRRAQ